MGVRVCVCVCVPRSEAVRLPLTNDLLIYSVHVLLHCII